MDTEVTTLWHYTIHTHTHTHIRLTALCPGLPGWAGTRNVKPIWILKKQETVSGSGISLAICKSAPCPRQTTMPAHHHSIFTGRMPFLSPNQQCQSTEGQAFSASVAFSAWPVCKILQTMYTAFKTMCLVFVNYVQIMHTISSNMY